MLAAFKSVTTSNFKGIHFVGYEDDANLRKNVTLMFENVPLCEKADIKGIGSNKGNSGFENHFGLDIKEVSKKSNLLSSLLLEEIYLFQKVFRTIMHWIFKLHYRSRALKSHSELRAALGILSLHQYILKNLSLCTVTFGDKVPSFHKSRGS